MVRKIPCNQCKGNKVVTVKTTSGRQKDSTCPSCGGNGYKIEVSLSAAPR